MNNIEIHPTRCAICGIENDSTQLYPASLDNSAFNPAVFSARRSPDRIHYRIVKCRRCGLVRSDPVADPEIIESLYKDSSFDYSGEVQNIRKTYGRYLDKLQGYGAKKGSLLEIGCGDGFFLEEALTRGYESVRGVEPSVKAVKMARPHMQGRIVCDVMHSGLFKDEEFDVICMFQLLDHVATPGMLIKECFRLLKKGGFVLCINHNIDSFTARILKERSPIIDVKHAYLYNLKTAKKTFSIKVNENGITLKRFDKTMRIEWQKVNSFIYQCGHPYWFFSLALDNDKRVNIHGEIENYESLFKFIKNKISHQNTEFRYTIRRKLTLMLLLGIIVTFLFSITIVLSRIDVAKRMSPYDAIGIPILLIALTCMAVLVQFIKAFNVFFITEKCLSVRTSLGKHISISWPEISGNVRIDYGKSQATFTQWIDKFTIITDNSTISFCEDLDNIDEFLEIIYNKSGLRILS